MSLLLRKLMGNVYQAEEEGDAGAQGSGNDARVALLNKIGEQSETNREGDFRDVSDEEHDPEAQEALATAAAAKAELEAAAATKDAAEAAAAQSASAQKVKIKVNGVEKEVTLEELITNAQKVEAADQYLAEAARLRNELAAQRKPSDEDASKQQQEVDSDLALARAIQMGNEEEAVAAIRKIKSAGPSQDDLTRTIDERLTFNEAIAKFRTDFSDVAGDQYLNKMAQDMDTELIKGGDKRSYDARYTEIGTKLRGWVASKAPKTEPQQNDKQARKEAAPVTPAAASGKAASSIEEEKDESTSEVIANMAKQRGGPQWMRGLPGQT